MNVSVTRSDFGDIAPQAARITTTLAAASAFTMLPPIKIILAGRGADPAPQPVRAAVASLIAVGARARAAAAWRRAGGEIEDGRTALDAADALRIHPIAAALDGRAARLLQR